MERLEKVQKRMVAAVTGLKGSTYEEKLSELSMTTLANRRKIFDLQQAYKIISQKDDVDPITWFTYIRERPIGTRLASGGLNLAQPRARLETCQNFRSCRVVECWNHLPNETKLAKTVIEFRKKIRA